LYANFTSTIRLEYLMLPVMVKYRIDLSASGKWKFYVDGGLFGGLLMTAGASASGTSKVYLDKEQMQPLSSLPVNFDSTGNIKNQLHKGNFGIEGNIGLIYQVNSIGILAEAGGNYGFIDLQKDNRNGINHTGALIFRVGMIVIFDTNELTPGVPLLMFGVHPLAFRVQRLAFSVWRFAFRVQR